MVGDMAVTFLSGVCKMCVNVMLNEADPNKKDR